MFDSCAITIVLKNIEVLFIPTASQNSLNVSCPLLPEQMSLIKHWQLLCILPVTAAHQ